MLANRRRSWNFSLQRAVDWAREFRKPLIILEALRCRYRWTSDRLRRLVLDGVVDQARQLSDPNVLY